MTTCKFKCNNFFLSDSTTRPSDLPLYVIVESFLVGVLGLSRPNVSIQQVSTKGGKSYIQELERKKIAVVIGLTRVHFHRFHSVFHSLLLALTLNYFLCGDLFCFCKPMLSRSVNKYCWFLLMLPLLYVVTGHIMCPVKLCYIIQHLRHVDNEKVGSFNVEPHHVCLCRLLDATFFNSFPPVTSYSSYVARGEILLL